MPRNDHPKRRPLRGLSLQPMIPRLFISPCCTHIGHDTPQIGHDVSDPRTGKTYPRSEPNNSDPYPTEHPKHAHPKVDPKPELTWTELYPNRNFRQILANPYPNRMTSLLGQKSVDLKSTQTEVHLTQTEPTQNVTWPKHDPFQT